MGIILAMRTPPEPSSMISVDPQIPAVTDIVRDFARVADRDRLATLEWLVTNGLGGYASGTIAGVMTRRYHALLVAALPAPLGRMVLVSRLDERVRLAGGRIAWLSRLGNAADGVAATHFRLAGGLPIWTYELEGTTIEKRLIMPRLQNTVIVCYHVTRAATPIRLGIRPHLHARPHEAAVDYALPASPVLIARGGYLEATLDAAVPPLVLDLRDHE